MFHEHEPIEDMEKNVSDAKLTYEGLADLTPERIELKEPVIEEGNKVVMIVIREVLIRGRKSLH